jgi:hypothetical protein
MLLTADEHCIGRLVGDTRFQIESNAVSANHCKIYRRRLSADDSSEHTVFLKDTRFVHCSSKAFILFLFYYISKCTESFAAQMGHISIGRS